MNKKTSFAISVICIVSTAFLVLLSGMIPFFSILFMLMASVFSAYCLVNCGVGATVVNGIVSAFVAMLMGGFQPGMLIVPAMGIIPGIVSGAMFKKNDYYARLIGVVIGFLAVYVFALYMSTVALGIGIGDIFNEGGASAKLIVGNITQTHGGIDSGDMEEMIDAVVAFSKMIFPSIIIVFVMGVGYVHLALLNSMTKKFGGEKGDYVYLDSHCAPRSMSYVYIVTTIILLFVAKGTFSVVLNNVVVIIDAILAFCGFSFIENKLKGKLKYGFVRWFIYVVVMLFFNSIVIQVLSVIGMFDSYIDYRRVRRGE